ncbi:MAG: metallophosphoesterase family protein [Myxococcales bacterium]|nr:metallophosphoesterase family protein [Myxococcales bacterium]
MATQGDALRGPLAFLADIHGNLKALDAVLLALDDVRAAGVFVCGDLLFEGDDPLGVWKRLQAVGARCVRGTTDKALARLDPAKMPARTEAERAALARFVSTREAVGELILARLDKLPEALKLTMPGGQEWLVVHGSPRDPDEFFTHDMGEEEIEDLLADETADVVVCGGSHVSFVRKVPGTVVVSVGSVGAAPEGRVAHFALITPTPEGPHIEPRWVAY